MARNNNDNILRIKTRLYFKICGAPDLLIFHIQTPAKAKGERLYIKYKGRMLVFYITMKQIHINVHVCRLF